jgi:hypothetical protein
MLRQTTLCLFTLALINPAFSADQIPAPHVKRHAKVILPAGLPRPHYKYRTTIVYDRPAPPAYIETDALISFPSTPLLPGRQELPGYYGRAFSYDYQGPYYGGPYESYFFRLPYACGVYGYC